MAVSNGAQSDTKYGRSLPCCATCENLKNNIQVVDKESEAHAKIEPGIDAHRRQDNCQVMWPMCLCISSLLVS